MTPSGPDGASVGASEPQDIPIRQGYPASNPEGFGEERSWVYDKRDPHIRLGDPGTIHADLYRDDPANYIHGSVTDDGGVMYYDPPGSLPIRQSLQRHLRSPLYDIRGWRFGSENHMLWWNPGEHGRGFVLPNGSVHTWPEEHGSHLDIAHARDIPSNDIAESSFVIRPDGTAKFPYRYRNTDPSVEQDWAAQIQAADPRLTYAPLPNKFPPVNSDSNEPQVVLHGTARNRFEQPFIYYPDLNRVHLGAAGWLHQELSQAAGQSHPDTLGRGQYRGLVFPGIKAIQWYQTEPENSQDVHHALGNALGFEAPDSSMQQWRFGASYPVSPLLFWPQSNHLAMGDPDGYHRDIPIPPNAHGNPYRGGIEHNPSAPILHWYYSPQPWDKEIQQAVEQLGQRGLNVIPEPAARWNFQSAFDVPNVTLYDNGAGDPDYQDRRPLIFHREANELHIGPRGGYHDDILDQWPHGDADALTTTRLSWGMLRYPNAADPKSGLQWYFHNHDPQQDPSIEYALQQLPDFKEIEYHNGWSFE